MGYTLTSVGVHTKLGASSNSSRWDMKVCNDSSEDPGTICTTLTKPGTLNGDGVNTFTAPGAGINLSASTTYHVVMDITAAFESFITVIQNTASNNEDTGGAAGWSIANSSSFRSWGSAGNWSGYSESRKIRITGYAKSDSPPDAPVGTGQLSADNITQTGARLTLADRQGQLWYWAADHGPHSRCSASQFESGAWVDLTGLTPGTTYRYGAYADVSCERELGRVTFTTRGEAPPPPVYVPDDEITHTGQLRAERVTSTTARLVHTGYEHGTLWYYAADKPPHGRCSASQFESGAWVDLTGLAPNTAYTYRAYADFECGTELGSATFTTAPAPEPPPRAPVTPPDDSADAVPINVVPVNTGALSAGDITATGARLTLTGRQGQLWYWAADQGPHGRCSASQVESGAWVDLTGLTPNTAYTYRAYADVSCTNELGSATFGTLLARGKAAPAAAVNVNPGALQVDPTDDPATEADERTATYRVSLNSAPDGPVTVTPASSDTTIAAVSGSLTFTTTNWATPQTVTITGMADGRVGITHSITGGGYDAAPAPEVTVVVGDGGGDERKAPGRSLARATKRDAPDESPDLQHAPPGALAALARGHLAGVHAALTPRLNAGDNETSHITLAGHTLALDESLLSGLSAAALDWDALPHPHGLSWFDATGRCASWTTASCGEADNMAMTGVHAGLDNASLYGQPAGPWDGLLYNLATGLAGGGMTQSLWRNSGFVLTLGNDTDTGPGRRWTLWGQHRVQAVTGLPAGTDHDGELRNGWLGLDTTFGDHARMGLALSRSGGQAPLRAVHPYLTWSDGITTVSALGGFGRSSETDRRWHRHTASEPDSQANTPATALTHAPLGLRMGLVEVQRMLGVFGHLQLALRADAAWASLSAGEGATVQTETVRRLRAGLDASGSWQGIAGLTFTPSLQAHLRSDTGDGTTGRGLELAGGIHAGYGPARLTVQGRMLTARSEATTRERGIESTLSLGQPGSPGPSLSLSARWGDAAVGGDTLWQERLHYYHEDIHTLNNAWSLDARSEVGLILPGGVRLTGFTSLSHDGFGPRVLFGLQRGHPAPAK